MAYSYAGFSRPTITDSMIPSPRGPLTRPLRVALLCGAAVLCLPPAGFAEPIGVSNRAAVRLASFMGMADAGRDPGGRVMTLAEPNTLVLFGTGLLVAAALMRRRFGAPANIK